MKFLSWYSTALIGFSTLSLLISVMSGTSPNTETDMWAIAMFIPVMLFLILIHSKKVIK